MDYSIILGPLIDTATWLIPAMLLIGLLKSPWAKGHIGNALNAAAHWLSAPRNQARKQGSRSGAERRFPSEDQTELFEAQGTIGNRGLSLIVRLLAPEQSEERRTDAAHHCIQEAKKHDANQKN